LVSFTLFFVFFLFFFLCFVLFPVSNILYSTGICFDFFVLICSLFLIFYIPLIVVLIVMFSTVPCL
jgi:hypothetical protein